MERPYFAYGSNMLLARIRERVPSARALGRATLEGYRLTFRKVGADGSGKCDIEPASPDEAVHGVLFALDPTHGPALDRAEERGYGYERCTVRVRTAEGEREAFTYRALRRDAALRPYGWYHALVVAGAREHALPMSYIETLESQPVVEDPDPQRRGRHEMLLGAADRRR